MLFSTLASLLILSILGNADDVLGVEQTLVQIGYPLRLLCNTTNDPVKWYKDEVELKADDRIEISTNPNQLTVNRVMAKDGGSYNCKLGALPQKEFTVGVEPQVKFPAKSVNAIGGEKFELKCEAAAYPEPTLSWLKDDIPIDLYNKSSRYTFGPGDDSLVNAVLKIEVLEEQDGGIYTCIADIQHLSANSTVLVRVKDKWAALYPFIGIVIEVIILVAIIFIYEKKRSKDRQEEEDDHAREKSAVNNKDSEVRHRK